MLAKTRAILLFFVLSTPVFAQMAPPPPPPPPPPNWEESVTPGFEPSVESVVVRSAREQRIAREELQQIWKGWGPEATDVLFKMLADPLWKGHLQHVFGTLSESPYPETLDRIESEIRARFQEPRSESLRPSLLGMLTRMNPERAHALVVEMAKSSDPALAEDAIGWLMNYHTPEDQALAEETLAKLPEEVRARWAPSVERARGFLRAKEPMNATPAVEPRKEQKP